MRRLYHWTVFGAAGFGYGQGVVVMWPEWSAWTWWGLATAMLPLLAIPTIWDQRHALIAASPKLLLPFVSALTLVALVVGAGAGGYFLAVSLSGPATVWGHPILSSAEQERVKAKCEMRAAEVIQGGAIKDMARNDYKENCLVAEGFTRVLVEEDERLQ